MADLTGAAVYVHKNGEKDIKKLGINKIKTKVRRLFLILTNTIPAETDAIKAVGSNNLKGKSTVVNFIKRFQMGFE